MHSSGLFFLYNCLLLISDQINGYIWPILFDNQMIIKQIYWYKIQNNNNNNILYFLSTMIVLFTWWCVGESFGSSQLLLLIPLLTNPYFLFNLFFFHVIICHIPLWLYYFSNTFIKILTQKKKKKFWKSTIETIMSIMPVSNWQ